MLGCDACAVRTAGASSTHHGFARLAHDRANVFKVNVDVARHIDDFRNTANSVFKHVIGVGKGFFLRDIITQHFKQLFVQHNDQRVDIRLQLCQTSIRVGHAATAFKIEGLGHDTHRQNAHFLGNSRDHRCSAGACSAAHTRRNEQHVRARNGRANIFLRELGRFATLVGLAARAQTGSTELDGPVRSAPAQGLCVGVGADKFHALNSAADHVANGIAATASHADDLDLRALVEFFVFHHLNHGEPPVSIKYVC